MVIVGAGKNGGEVLDPGLRGRDDGHVGRVGGKALIRQGTQNIRDRWTFRRGHSGSAARAGVAGQFWETLHIDLRMVDTSDFVVAYCPTNIYSVGTPHEIVLARQQRKPVLFVSPPVEFPTLDELRQHLANDSRGTDLLARLEAEVPIKPNPRGVPSLWYLPLVGGEQFFDGFGFRYFRESFGWERTPLEASEEKRRLENPLLPFLERLDRKLPKKWDPGTKRLVRNDDWLLWDLAGPDDPRPVRPRG